jgi:hypothetical protein
LLGTVALVNAKCLRIVDIILVDARPVLEVCCIVVELRDEVPTTVCKIVNKIEIHKVVLDVPLYENTQG